MSEARKPISCPNIEIFERDCLVIVGRGFEGLIYFSIFNFSCQTIVALIQPLLSLGSLSKTFQPVDRSPSSFVMNPK